MRPHEQHTETPADISKIIAMALSYQTPQNMPWFDLNTPRMWVAQGCDIDKDILPVMKEIMAKKKGLKSYSYFTNAVIVERDKRLIKEKYEAEKPPIDCDQYIKNYQWKRKMGLELTEQQRAALDAYENKKALSEERA